MLPANNDPTLEATEDQLALLRELGVEEARLEEITYEDAEELIAELQAMREDAGRVGRD